jgi:hypothetical protein
MRIKLQKQEGKNYQNLFKVMDELVTSAGTQLIEVFNSE